ncbi:uncharacterized protein LOC118437262 [Folsomia candida]|uniref:uncharacterized protein LOC118437262 n=1 Tax=Folsomia candida TaxID=158441 RepID=UPI0016053562|nr:uncharacterized protein LOC118437262 [Folsomia candida]
MESRGERNVQVALSNPIILTAILKQASAPLKTCRLVSHFWNEIVLSLKNTKLALNLEYKMNSENNALPFFEMCYPSDDRIAKRISATCCTYWDRFEPPHQTNLFSYRIMHIGDKFSHQIQILHICIDFEDCLHAVFQILKNFCPNLKQLKITINNDYDDNLAGPILPAALLPKPNLTLVEVYALSVVTPSLTSLIQLVVNASPNLRKVLIPWGIYPDFVNLKSLGSLTTSLDNREMDAAQIEVNPTELSPMLGQVADQLVSLSFEVRNHYGRQARFDFENFNSTRFRLPRNMSKLKTFENDMIDISRYLSAIICRFSSDMSKVTATVGVV